MGVFTLPNREKYDALPENFRGEIATVFEEKMGRGFAQYRSGNSAMTPRQQDFYNELLDHYTATYENALSMSKADD